MRFRPFLILTALAFLLSGCSSSDSDTGDDETAATIESNKPDVEVPSGSAPTSLVVEDLEAGDGDEIVAESFVELRYVGVLFDGGEEFSSRWDDDTFKFVLGRNVGIPGLEEGVEGMNVGGRRQIIVPPEDGYGEVERPGIPSNSTLVFLVEAVRTFVEPEVANIDEPATELEVEVLIEGDGNEVEAGAEMVVNYTGLAQSTGEIFDSSWPRGEPSAFPLDGVIEGWQEGMLGQTVGSRVRLTIPGDLAYADAPPSPAIGPNDTLIFVVDILEAEVPLIQVPTENDPAAADPAEADSDGSGSEDADSDDSDPATTDEPSTTN